MENHHKEMKNWSKTLKNFNRVEALTEKFIDNNKELLIY
jgi:hypothetical protein